MSARGLSITEDGAQLLMASEVGGSEGPVWDGKDSLYFTGRGRIFRLDAGGTTHVFREASGGANGLLFDRERRLEVCEAANARVMVRRSSF